jgi:DNA-binding transcriptional ArsR family regulator
MLTTSGLAQVAALVGDPTRAAMLMALMDGRALTASEMATAAGVSAATTSGHLAQLVEGGLLAMERQGRHRYHRLASPLVAGMLEGIMAIAATPGARVRTGPRDLAMRRARTCYNHLAGRVAVGIADSMVACGHVELCADGGAVTPSGAALLQSIGIDLDGAPARQTRRLFCRPCLDWSERRPHIAGTVGAALLARFFAKGWMRPMDGSRTVAITQAGRRAMGEIFTLDHEIWADR